MQEDLDLGDALLLQAIAQRRRGGGATLRSKEAPASRSQLPAELGGQLSAVHGLFDQWKQEAAGNRTSALGARPFPSPQVFLSALDVFNQRGERRSRSGRTLQDWYFAPRRRPTHTLALPCHRCQVFISRQEVYYIDAAKPWRQADEMCGVCMTYVLRSVLGEDDARIIAEAEALLESAWRPHIDVALAEALLPRRTFFASAV